MAKMMGKAKHFGRWSIDRREDNQSARAQEARVWLREVEDDLADREAVEGREKGLQGPERGTL